MTSQILKSVNFKKTQKSRYLKKETSFFLQIKKIINYTSIATLSKKSFAAEVTFNLCQSPAFGSFCNLSFAFSYLLIMSSNSCPNASPGKRLSVLHDNLKMSLYYYSHITLQSGKNLLIA